MTISNKKDFYSLYVTGHFGNMPVNWSTLGEFKECDKKNSYPLVGLRTKSSPGLKLPYYSKPLSVAKAIEVAEDWVKYYGLLPEEIAVSVTPNQEDITMQGEVCQSPRFFDLTCTFIKKIMREALLEKSYYFDGCKANALLRYYMDDSSYENLCRLLKDYDGAIVEFTCFRTSLGTLNQNTLFWEVRHY